MTKPKISMMLDSGAYSAFTKNKEISLKDYIEFIKKNSDSIAHVVNLDSINPQNPEDAASVGRKNFLEMRQAGIESIPVHHAKESLHWLELMVNDCSYIGVSGTSIVSPIEVYHYYDLVYQFLCDSKGYPIVNTHLFGDTSPRSLLNYPAYSADSVTGDSMLLIKQAGRIRVESIEELFLSTAGRWVNRTEKASTDFKDLVDIETLVPGLGGAAEWVKADKVIRHDTVTNIYEVRGRCGKTVKATKSHGVFTNNSGYERKFICKSPKELKVKEDNIVGLCPSITAVQSGLQQLSELTIEIDSTPIPRSIERNATKAPLVRKLPYRVIFDEKLLEFFGLWIADGHMDGSYIGISAANDFECLTLVREIASRFSRDVGIEDNGVDCGFNSDILSKVITALGFGRYSRHKEIPWWLFQLSKEKIGAFLRGYYSGDGSSTGGCADCGTVSNKLFYGIYYLLTMLGISPSVIVSFRSSKDQGGFHNPDLPNTGGGISILDIESLKIFSQYAGFLQKRKQDSLLIATNRELGHKGGKRDLKFNDEEYLKLVEVKKISYNDFANKQFVYDLSVPGPQYFVANGLLVHNSATWMIQAGRAARVNLDGKSIQLRSSKIRDTSYICNSDTGPKRQSWEEAITRLGLNPERVMNVASTQSQMAMIRAYLVASELLKLQERSRSCTKFGKGVSLINGRKQEDGGKEREGPCICHFVLSPSAWYFNFVILASLNVKHTLVSYHYVADAPKTFWESRMLPFLYDPIGFCEREPKLRKYWDKLHECLLTPVGSI